MNPRQPRPPTLKDLGKALNLSARAVSQALYQQEGTVKVSEATRLKVQALAAEMGYRHNPAARALRSGRTGMLGILSFQGLDSLHSKRLYYAVRAARDEGWTPLVYQVDTTSEETCQSACNAMFDSRVDGVLVLSAFNRIFGKRQLKQFLDAGVHIVSLGAPWLKEVARFDRDKEADFLGIARHLIAEGYTSIGLVVMDSEKRANKNVHPGSYRYSHGRAAKQALLRAAGEAEKEGRKVNVSNYPLVNSAFVDKAPALGDIHTLHVPGYIAMRRLLAEGELPDAVMFQVDNWALGALRACAEAGVRVPEDLAITGFEGDPAASVGSVPLTTVAYPVKSLCRRSIQELTQAIRTRIPPKVRLELTSGELVIRQSSVRRRLTPPDLSELHFT